MQENEEFAKEFPNARFKLLQKIGQGTFSSVYKAEDLDHNDHHHWCYRHKNSTSCGFVALKRIYPTSSPHRIHSELEILYRLSNHPNIAPLITAFRNEDRVVAVLPYVEFDQFKLCMKKMKKLDIQCYFRCLLSALAYMHAKGFIHRDIKPSNFLYNINDQRGVLVDFGLAEIAKKDSTKKFISKDRVSPRLGYIPDDTRPAFRAPRAGTRGFRAPEVLFRIANQTTAIDIWSVGVIFLCIATAQYPFFQSNSDSEALLEIANIFGKARMKQLAERLDRIFETNLPSIQDQITFYEIVERMNPNFVDMIGEDGMALLNEMLTLDPEERPSAAKLLEHQFFQTLPINL